MNNFILYLAATFSFLKELERLNPFKNRDTDFYDLLKTIIDTATTLSGLVAVGFAIFGGYLYITAAGNPEQGKKAVSSITWSIIGLIIILSANLIIKFVLQKIK